MKTRTSNAEKHPGEPDLPIIKRRSKAEVTSSKKAEAAARAEKTAQQESNVEAIATLEDSMVVDDDHAASTAARPPRVALKRVSRPQRNLQSDAEREVEGKELVKYCSYVSLQLTLMFITSSTRCHRRGQHEEVVSC